MAYYDSKTGWNTTKLHAELNYNSNLFSQQEHTENIKRLVKAEENIEVLLNQYQSPDTRTSLESLKKMCQPHMLLGPIGGYRSIGIVDQEKKIFAVSPDIRSAEFNDEFDQYEYHDYTQQELTKSELCEKEETKYITLEIIGCYESTVASYFKIFGLSTRQKIDEAQIYSSEKEGDGGAKWEAYCKTYFASLDRRKTYLNNLIAAIHAASNDNTYPPEPEVKNNASLQKGFVYFIRNRDLYKIGITENLLRRFDELKPDEILNVVRCSNFKQLEHELHKQFKSVRLPQTEYFRLSTEMIEQTHKIMSQKASY